MSGDGEATEDGDVQDSTTPAEIYRSVRFMFREKERGGLGR
jgi:hypothetical protein